jgi:hypothetical protein
MSQVKGPQGTSGASGGEPVEAGQRAKLVALVQGIADGELRPGESERASLRLEALRQKGSVDADTVLAELGKK